MTEQVKVNNKPQHTGLAAALSQLPPSQAVTVGEMLELIKIVNHNSYRMTEEFNDLHNEVAELKAQNKKMAKLLLTSSHLTSQVANRVTVIDKDLDGVYADLNKSSEEWNYERDSIHHVKQAFAKQANDVSYEVKAPQSLTVPLTPNDNYIWKAAV